jgi:hypothetical protein
MNLRCLTALFGLSAVVAAARADVTGREHNAWPFAVTRADAAGRRESWAAAGPLLFSKPAADAGTQTGLRPFWVQTTDARGDYRGALFLYPLFSYSADAETYQWSVLSLINRTGRRAGAPPRQSQLENLGGFDVWPFWFSRDTGDAATSYRALFPIAGTIKHRLSSDRLSWVAWPFYFVREKKGAVTTSTPWPFLRVTRGAAHGFALWPLYGREERPGVSRQEFYLWPLGYNSTTQPAADAPAGTPPTRAYAALPFYAHASGPGYRGETYLWPFFGYTDRTAPERYHESRYFWPFFVQGRGTDLFVNRWGPFYTHSVMHGYDKTWIAWPLFKELRWTSEGVAQTKRQLLLFLYWSRVQHSVANPQLPPASITHLWPLVSVWDNGAGRRQWQFPSPLEVFFPGNEKVRAAWTPLFAFVRHDQRAPGDVRTSILWDGVTWERHDAEQRTEFHLGPLFSATTHAGEHRIAIGNGLLSFTRTATTGWRLFWLDFRSKPATVPASPAP